MSLSQFAFWVIPIIALGSYCLLLLFMAITRKDRFIRLFMVILTAMIIWTASSLFMKLEIQPSPLFWNHMMVAGMLCVPVLIYIFVGVFTKTANIFSITVWCLLAVAALVVNFMGLVVTDAQMLTVTVVKNGIQRTEAELSYTLGPMAMPIYAFYFVLIINTLRKSFKSVKMGNTTHGQLGLITSGVFIMFLGVLFNLVPAIGKYPVDILACFINAILIVIAVYKYRLFELRFILTRGLVFFLFAVILTAAYVYLVLVVQRYLGDTLENINQYFSILLALLVAIVFQPLYSMVGRIVNRLFYRTEYSQRQALRDFWVNISGKLDLNDIAAQLIEAIQPSIRSQKAYFLLKEEEKDQYCIFRSSSQIDKPDLVISFHNPIVKWLISNNTSLTKKEMNSLPIFKSMWDKEKETLDRLNIQVIIPIKSRDDLIGMLMLTEKDNNSAYNLDDLELLAYLGSSTAVVFDNARLYSRAQSEALTDSITKLYNHRYFRKALKEQIKKVGSGELSLLMIDLDLFKLYNDLYGHLEGDNALERVSEILLRLTGQKGIVCRYGGEEFVILLPYCDSRSAYDLAERIRSEIQRTFSNTEDVLQKFLTASVGICTYPRAAPNEEELLKRADIAMYTAKNRGKNQTVIYTPNDSPARKQPEEQKEDILAEPAYATTIYALTAAIDTKDHYTFGHSQRVAEYATILASSMCLDKSHVEMIREAALLHDIGKIGIAKSILTKTTRLTNEEREIVKKHVEMSITIIKHIPSFNHVIPAVIAHHERWDGKGYPRGLMLENIPLAARCLAVVDAFDAMTSERPYRSAYTVSAALREIENNMGTQFDPKAASLFIKLVREGIIRVEQDKKSKNKALA